MQNNENPEAEYNSHLPYNRRLLHYSYQLQFGSTFLPHDASGRHGSHNENFSAIIELKRCYIRLLRETEVKFPLRGREMSEQQRGHYM